MQQLHYLDPTDNQNKTCTNNCPLLTDPTVPYQDFLFDSDMDVTGFQLTLSGWKGASAGLHLVQLLSSGAFASAIDSQNGQSCFAPGPSNVTRTGDWTEKDVDTSIPSTVQAVLVSEVNVGTSQADGPSFTWMPYISASGEYDINLLVPGCTNFQDCPLRTSVQVTVFPGGGQNPWVTNITQQNTQDSTTLIYRGAIVPTTPDFHATITMVLANNPEGSGQNGKYEIVADRVQLVLTNANVTSFNSTSSSSNSSASISEQSFGFLEWPLSGTSTSSATPLAAIPTTAVTGMDSVGFGLLSALGGVGSVASTSDAIASVAQHPSGALFLGGKFSLTSGSANGASNIAVFKNGALTALSNNGLNGAVTSLVVDGDSLYVGGLFSDTAQASNGALKGIAIYSISSNTWSALQAGVNGAVTSLDIANNQVLVAGNFTEILTSTGSTSGQNAAGLATWDISTSSWVNSGGFLVGAMTFVGNGTSTNPQFVAGRVTSSSKFGASGFVMLQNGQNGQPEITPLGVQFDGSNVGNTTTNAVTLTRRAHHRRSVTSWIPNLNVLAIFKRQSTAATLAPLPSAAPAPAPAVLAGAFWTNTSSSQEVVIIGGNFSYTAVGASAQNLAVYNINKNTVTAFKGNQPNGTVRSLLVKNNLLYVGGAFAIQGVETNGFAIYDLVNQQWDLSGVDALQAASGASVLVRSITDSSADDHTVIVAGSFAQAGSTACRAICSLDTTTRKWSALGNGIQGDVSTVVYAGVSVYV